MTTRLSRFALRTSVLIGALLPWAVARGKRKNAAFRERTQAAHDAADAAFQHHFVEAGGVRWHYVEAGNPTGPAVLMLHGLPESWYSWSHVLPKLDPAFRYIVPDMKGYGRSTATDDDYNWHRVGDQTLALMDRLGIGQFFIIGHDWGAVIASVLVVDHPARVLGFVRMEADLKYTPGQPLKELYRQKPQWKLFQNKKLAIGFLSDAARVIDLVYPPRMTTALKPADRDYFVYEFSRPGVAEAIAHYFQYANWDLEAAVSKIANGRFDFPILQLQADQDPAQPMHLFDDVETLFPGIRLEWITDASHFDNLDQPDQVANAINRFLKTAAA